MMRTTGCSGCLDAIQSKALCLWVNIVTSNISLISTKQAHHQPQGLTTVFFRTCYRGTTLLNLLFGGRNCHLCRLRLLAFSSWVSITNMNPLPGYSSIPNLTCSVLEVQQSQNPQGEAQAVVSFKCSRDPNPSQRSEPPASAGVQRK